MSLFGPFARMFPRPLPYDASESDYYASALGDAQMFDDSSYTGTPPPAPPASAATTKPPGVLPPAPPDSIGPATPVAPPYFTFSGPQTTRRTQLFGPLGLLQPPIAG